LLRGAFVGGDVIGGAAMFAQRGFKFLLEILVSASSMYCFCLASFSSASFFASASTSAPSCGRRPCRGNQALVGVRQFFQS